MARYRRYTKTIVKSPRKKWNQGYGFGATNFLHYPQATWATFVTIIQNNQDTSNPTPTVIKCKHIKIQGSLFLVSTDQQAGDMQTLNWMCYIMFVPQVVYDHCPEVSPTSSYVQMYQYWQQVINDHPEWIMGRKLVSPKWQGGVPGEKVVSNFSFTSGKLTRNLRSGDRIICLFTGTYVGTQPATFPQQKVLLQCSFATCTN